MRRLAYGQNGCLSKLREEFECWWSTIDERVAIPGHSLHFAVVSARATDTRRELVDLRMILRADEQEDNVKQPMKFK